MNHRTLTGLLILILLSSCNSIQRLYVNYGAEQKLHRHTGSAIRIYFDRKGFIYPDADINDAALRKNDSRLEALYASNPQLYKAICNQYHAQPYSGDWKDIQSYKDSLQTALVNDHANTINAATKNKIPVFIIHGYNEHPSKPNDKKSCFAENRLTAELISTHVRDKDFQFIEVYWDGMAAQNGTGWQLPFNSAFIWNNAQASATYAGLELRRIFAKLQAPEIYVITHSHGAGVITTALFNVIKFRVELYDRAKHWLYDIKHNRYNNAMYNTPTQQFHVGMLAPAIPGVNVFREYDQRTINGVNTASGSKNYHFVVGFNSNDPVTSKGWVAAAGAGSTTLASMPKELERTRALFGNDPAVMDSVSFNRFSSGKRQVKHGWPVYMTNEPHFTRFVQKTFGN